MKPEHMYGRNTHLIPSTSIRRAIVLKVSTEDNILFADIMDNFLGNIYTNVQVANYHHTDGSVSNYPLVEEQEILYLYNSESRKPIIIGSLPTQRFEGYDNTVSLGDENYPSGKIRTDDYHTQNKNNFMNISKDNGISVKSDIIRLQIEQVLRICDESNGTIDSPLNGQRFLDILFPYLIELEAKVLANSAAITVIGTDAAEQASARAVEAEANQDQATASQESAKATQITTATTTATTTLLSSTAAGNQIDANLEVNTKVKLPQ